MKLLRARAPNCSVPTASGHLRSVRPRPLCRCPRAGREHLRGWKIVPLDESMLAERRSRAMAMGTKA
jgi:hypothetical protein